MHVGRIAFPRHAVA